MSMRVRPLTGKALVRVIGPIPQSSVIESVDRHISPEEQQQLNHAPKPPPPLIGIVEELGPWPALKNGLRIIPPFTVGAQVLLREGSGQQLARGTDQRLRMIGIGDVLAVLSDQ